jgi:hypothetical protein
VADTENFTVVSNTTIDFVVKERDALRARLAQVEDLAQNLSSQLTEVRDASVQWLEDNGRIRARLAEAEAERDDYAARLRGSNEDYRKLSVKLSAAEAERDEARAMRDSFREQLDFALAVSEKWQARLSAYEGLETAAKDHVYISTACLHGEHAYCAAGVRADGGVKQPGRCKFCDARCRCTGCDHSVPLDGPSSPPQDTVAPSAHVYVSTACWHGEHAYCAAGMRADGTRKKPGQCKFCSAPCTCTGCDHSAAEDSVERPAGVEDGAYCVCPMCIRCGCGTWERHHASLAEIERPLAAPPTDTEVTE